MPILLNILMYRNIFLLESKQDDLQFSEVNMNTLNYIYIVNNIKVSNTLNYSRLSGYMTVTLAQVIILQFKI